MFCISWKHPFSDFQLANISHNLILESTALTKSRKNWEKRNFLDQTWHDFKNHFSEACAEHEEFQATTVNDHASNTMHQTHLNV